MRTVLPGVGGVFLLCVLAAGPLHAQEDKEKDKGGMHQLVVYNGGLRTVHYYGGDANAARDRARRENEVAVADFVSALRVQYLRNEQALEARRHQVNMLLYGYSTSYETGPYPGSGSYGGGGYWPLSGWGYGWGGPLSGLAIGSGTATLSLQYSVGDEGPIKRELIQGLGAPAPKQP
jgi:hypothetical protein